MTRRVKTIEGEAPPWRLIKRPAPRMTADPRRYVRSELAWVMRRPFPTFDCVVVSCPCGEDPHDLTIRHVWRSDGGDTVALSCEAGTKSDAVLEAILSELS